MRIGKKENGAFAPRLFFIGENALVYFVLFSVSLVIFVNLFEKSEYKTEYKYHFLALAILSNSLLLFPLSLVYCFKNSFICLQVV